MRISLEETLEKTNIMVIDGLHVHCPGGSGL